MKTYDFVQAQSVEHLKPDELSGKRVLLRVDMNVPLDNDKVASGGQWRITASLPTIEFLVNAGAKVIIIGHIGRDPEVSMRPVYEYVAEQGLTVGFIPELISDRVTDAIDAMGHGGVVMLENLRSEPGEKTDSQEFAQQLAKMADIYVNDAFAVSHRSHASVHAIVEYLPSYFGLQFVHEVQHLDFSNKDSSLLTLVLGGAKFGTKLELLRKFLPSIQYALVGGALANVFLRERGINIGSSFADDVDISDMVDHEKIILPIDCIDQEGDVVDINDISGGDMILDIGPATEQLFESIINHSDTVLWNGPMGKYEDGYTSGSHAIAESLSYAEATSITGGGDTAAVLLEQDMVDNFDFVSTGGGAMLDFLVQGTLPAIEVVKNKKQVV